MTELSEELVLPVACTQGEDALRISCISKWLSIPLQGVPPPDLQCILDSMQRIEIIEDCYDVGFSLGKQVYGMQDSRLDGEDPNDALRFTLELCLHACRDSCYHGAIQEWLKKRIGQADADSQRIGGEILQEMTEDMNIFQHPPMWQRAVIGGMGRALHSLHPDIASEACTYFDTSPTLCAEATSYSHGDLDPEWHQLSTCDKSEISFDDNVFYYHPLKEKDLKLEAGEATSNPVNHQVYTTQAIFSSTTSTQEVIEIHERHSVSRHFISTLGATAFMIFSIVFLIRLSRINPKDAESSQNGFTRIEEFDLNIYSDEENENAGAREMTAI